VSRQGRGGTAGAWGAVLLDLVIGGFFDGIVLHRIP
jgi:uncharacterized membrane protein